MNRDETQMEWQHQEASGSQGNVGADMVAGSESVSSTQPQVKSFKINVDVDDENENCVMMTA